MWLISPPSSKLYPMLDSWSLLSWNQPTIKWKICKYYSYKIAITSNIGNSQRFSFLTSYLPILFAFFSCLWPKFSPKITGWPTKTWTNFFGLKSIFGRTIGPSTSCSQLDLEILLPQQQCKQGVWSSSKWLAALFSPTT